MSSKPDQPVSPYRWAGPALFSTVLVAMIGFFWWFLTP